MGRRAKKYLVEGLEWSCAILDAIPWRENGRWYRYYGWGCILGVAKKAFELDERWKTDAWT